MPSPPEAADPARFAPPPGSHISQGLGESLRQTFGGPGWQQSPDLGEPRSRDQLGVSQAVRDRG